ncbi:GMC family oxidoreductase [Haloarcula sp. S1CR25-12]|uniref:GMC family oxidoreductase n=1 Tax=Haloarcula saliterrae TaxID=2950534 RepID=A0ABU2FG78_9EURY|nr:GMC family oxidoreductase [Haloarcula sp. S1CR25-12]MDS0261270.1 GMC family oxidoreductase [Haloarcula sp. S1CR25-12]
MSAPDDRTPADSPTVCVVGAGLAGALVADALAGRGREVALLDAGPTVDRDSRYERMQRQLRPGTTAAEIWGMDGERDAYTAAGAGAWPVNERRVKGVGGTTLNWLGVTPRFRPSTFETATRHGVGRDWPISYADLRPYYAEAEQELCVAGNADAPFQPPRETAYPQPPLERSHSDELFAAAGEELAVPVHSLPVARGPDSERRDRRPDGGAPSRRVRPPEATYSADTHVERAVASGARLIDRAAVERLEHGPDGERVTAAVYRTPDGARHRQDADVFVAACGTIETPRLLLLSDSPQYPDGLGNSSGVVGRYLMGQPPATVLGVLDEPTKQREVGSPTTGSYQFAAPEADRAGFALTCLNNAGETPAELALREESWGDRLLEEVQFHHGNTVGLSIRVGSLPRAANRVTLDETTTDDRGDPVPDVQFSPGPFAARAQEAAIALGTDLVEALDGAVVYADGTTTTDELPPAARGGHYAVGGTRMGTDPETSVVDPTCRSHDLKNLYVAGGSPFVTSGAVPPALTIAALALRTADHVDGRL